MTFKAFILANMRWLLGGLNLTFFSSFGQTFFIALFAGQLREQFSISHGQFGSLYMLGTLASAVTLVFIGRVLDFQSIRQVASVVICALAGACVVMANVHSIATLVLAIYLLRLAGQGMMTHTAMTAMGKWFVAERGRAVSVTSMGHQLGEGLLPVSMVVLLTLLEWRQVWLLCAAVLVCIALPVTRLCFQLDRQPLSSQFTRAEIGQQWTRSEALKDPVFWAIGLCTLAPSFIVTSIWFHQIHLLEFKVWSPSILAQGFILMAITTTAMSLISGQLVDRFAAHRLLSFILLPLGVGCLMLAWAENENWMLMVMFCMGVGTGICNAVFGAVWAEIYGVKHLGAIRSVVFAASVLSSAVGPGLTGWLIDTHVSFNQQLVAMGLFCFVVSLLQVSVSGVLMRRLQGEAVRVI